MRIFQSVIVFTCVFALPFTLQAQILDVDTVTATTELISADNLINGSGLDVNDLTGGHDNDNVATSMWLSHPATPPSDHFLTFTLTNPSSLDALHIWNFNQQGSPVTQGVDEMEVLVSPDADVLTATFSSLGTINLAVGSGASGLAAETFDATDLPGLSGALAKCSTHPL